MPSCFAWRESAAAAIAAAALNKGDGRMRGRSEKELLPPAAKDSEHLNHELKIKILKGLKKMMNSTIRNYKRGDIYYISSGNLTDLKQRRGRPAIIVSDDNDSKFSNTLQMVYLSLKDDNRLTNVTIRGTRKPSIALCDRVHNIEKSRVGDFCSRCTKQELQIITAVLASQGLNTDTRQKSCKPSPASFGLSPYRKEQSRELSLSVTQMKFLNPAACQYVNPYSKTFWSDLKNWLSDISSQSADYPKARHYRSQLAPHLLKKVTIIADSWELADTKDPNGLLHLELYNLRLLCAYGKEGYTIPNIAISHMHIWVSKAWMNLLPAYGAQAYGGQLTVTGTLYEYVSAKGTRNIGVMPILLEPENCRGKRLDSFECPGA